eukprot:gene18041-18278_t
MKQSGCKISIDQDRSDGSPRQIGLTGEPTGLAAAMTLIAQVMENNYSGLILNNDLTASSSSPTKLSPTAPVAPSLPEPALDVTQTTSLAPAPVSEKRSFSSSNQPSSPDSTPKTSSNLNKKLDSDNTNMQMNMRSIATALKGEFADSNLLSSSEKRAMPSRQEQTADAVVMCPQSKVGTLIGFKGSNVNEVMRRTGARIQIVQDNIPAGVDRKVCIFGQKNQVDEAIRMVNAIIQNGANGLVTLIDGNGHAVLTNGLIIEEKDIPPEKVGLVIGTKGLTISQIMLHSNCRININQNFPKGQNHKIAYTGTSEQIEFGKFLVETIIERGPQGMEGFFQNLSVDPLTIYETKINKNLLFRSLGQNILIDLQRRFTVKITTDEAAFADVQSKVVVIGRRSSIGEIAPFLQQFVGIPMDAGVAGYPNSAFVPQQPLPQPILHQQYQPQYSPQHAIPQQGYPYVAGNSPGLITVVNPPPTVAVPVSVAVPVPAPSPTSLQMFAGSPIPMPQHIQQPQPVPQPQPVAAAVVAPSGQILALGEDGKAGILEPARVLYDGNHQQIAEIKNELVGKFLGKQSVNINLIRSKSGAQVEAVKPIDPSKGFTHTAILLTGLPQQVSLASQMVQEVLINGSAKLLQMADAATSSNSVSAVNVPSSAASGAGGSSSHYSGVQPIRSGSDDVSNQPATTSGDNYSVYRSDPTTLPTGYGQQQTYQYQPPPQQQQQQQSYQPVTNPQQIPYPIHGQVQGQGQGLGYAQAQQSFGAHSPQQQYVGQSFYQQQPQPQQFSTPMPVAAFPNQYAVHPGQQQQLQQPPFHKLRLCHSVRDASFCDVPTHLSGYDAQLNAIRIIQLLQKVPPFNIVKRSLSSSALKDEDSKPMEKDRGLGAGVAATAQFDEYATGRIRRITRKSAQQHYGVTEDCLA